MLHDVHSAMQDSQYRRVSRFENAVYYRMTFYAAAVQSFDGFAILYTVSRRAVGYFAACVEQEVVVSVCLLFRPLSLGVKPDAVEVFDCFCREKVISHYNVVLSVV